MNIKLLKAQSILQEALQEALFDLEDTRLKNIAVTRVECTRGREMAKVFLDENSLGDMGANDALKLLKKASGAIRANLQAQLSWYKTPNLVFEIDKTLNEINKLESIFNKIHSKGENSSLGEGNSPLELHSADFGIFGVSQTLSLVSTPKIPKNYESQTENPSVVDSTHCVESNNNPPRHSELSQESEESKQNNLHEVQTESRPIRGAKNRIQTSSSASADFLLESEKRGSPPKSEKRQLLARRGSGAGGAALLQKETSESQSKKIANDSRIAKIDSSLTAFAQNDESVDCYDSAFAESRNNKAKSPQDEFATRN